MTEPNKSDKPAAKSNADRAEVLAQAAEVAASARGGWNIQKAREAIAKAGRAPQDLKFREDHGRFPQDELGFPVTHIDGTFRSLRHAVIVDGTARFVACSVGR